MDKKAFCAEFRDLVDNYLSISSARNITSLSKEADVSVSTVRRFYNSEAIPNSENVLKLLLKLKGVKQIPLLVSSLGDNSLLGKFVANTFDYLNDRVSFYTKTVFELKDELSNPQAYGIFKRISHDDKVTREMILELFGTTGLEILNNFISKKIVKEENGELSINDIHQFHLPSCLWKSHFTYLINTFMKPEVVLEKGNAAVKNLSQSTDQKGVDEIKEVLKEAAIKMQIIFDKRPGDIPLFFTGVLDTLTLGGEKDV